MLELDLWHLADVDFETKHVREKRTSLVRLQTVNHPRGRPAIDRPGFGASRGAPRGLFWAQFAR